MNKRELHAVVAASLRDRHGINDEVAAHEVLKRRPARGYRRYLVNRESLIGPKGPGRRVHLIGVDPVPEAERERIERPAIPGPAALDHGLDHVEHGPGNAGRHLEGSAEDQIQEKAALGRPVDPAFFDPEHDDRLKIRISRSGIVDRLAPRDELGARCGLYDPKARRRDRLVRPSVALYRAHRDPRARAVSKPERYPELKVPRAGLRLIIGPRL